MPKQNGTAKAPSTAISALDRTRRLALIESWFARHRGELTPISVSIPNIHELPVELIREFTTHGTMFAMTDQVLATDSIRVEPTLGGLMDALGLSVIELRILGCDVLGETIDGRTVAGRCRRLARELDHPGPWQPGYLQPNPPTIL